MIRQQIVIFATVVGLAAVGRTVAQDPEYLAIKVGRVITVADQEYAPGVIVIEDGKITAVGTGIEFPAGAEVIDAPRMTVMPGLIHPRTRYGLKSFKRSGVHGDQTAASEVYLNTIPFDELLEAGFTTVAFAPTGTDIPGSASVYRTAGDPDRRPLEDAAYLLVAASKKAVLRDALKKAQAEIKKVEKARTEWEEKQKKKQQQKKKEKEKPSPDQPEKKDDPPALPPGADDKPKKDGGGDPPEAAKKDPAKDDTFKPPKIDPKYQPLVDLIQKKEGVQLLIQLTSASGLLHLDQVVEPYDDLTHALFLAAGKSTDFHHVVESLGERKSRVVLAPWIHYMPQTTIRYNLLRDLVAAGCEVSVVPRRDRRSDVTDVRAHLAQLVRAGLDHAEALRMLTLHPARLLGLDDRIGAIEKERDADLVFFDGDPLDPHTEVQRVMIMGKTVYQLEEQD